MYAILDIETTGGKFNEEGITEIAIHKFDGHEVVDKFISLVNPEKEIQPFVVNLTGINNKMLRTAPKFHEVAKRIVEITDSTVLVAHNAQFDYRILRTEFRRLGYNFERKTLCTVDLSKKLIPEAQSHSLGKLVRSLGIPVSDRHRANGDAVATLKLFKVLLSKDSDKSIIKSVIRNKEHGELSDRQLDIVESLPSETGVYYMHDKDGDILYLGDSTNIKKRVNQHFTNSGKRSRQLQKATKKVSFERTGSELAAQLKTNEELIRNRPRYNQKLTKRNFSHGIFASLNERGYMTLSAQKIANRGNAIATFNSLAGAKNFIFKLTKDSTLCPKLNGISEAKKNCSNYDSGECKGACIEKENVQEYNQRVEVAIQQYSLNGKNEIIVDKGREIGEYCAILIKNGLFKGFGYYDLNHQINNIHILESIIVPMNGDQNTTHIIESYLRKRRVLKVLELSN
ncbi:exonuclease [Euzebyella marina]|uniref:Exonuclease n=1 Tax=Euzebyella marina TaxID=1761453 RepID=A0A3G2L6M9_9FLAO|nr:exonuclease domain-containing protein [Euzebyella marina]AYN67898.1 exonuclease [Euzebyella marina]MBG49457.1 exonuclease [Pseudozobellia sp.]|tara:strand:- start:624 stop:1991 length:1368 start_codon:yes stop_codon:yes gene_type:complete